MEPIIKETQVIRDYDNGGGSNLRNKANWALGLSIFGAAAGGLALARQGGLAGFFGGGSGSASPASPASTSPTNTVVYANTSGSGNGCCAPSGFYAFSKECEDILNLTNTVWGLKVGTMQSAQAARDVDVAEKFGLYQSQINADFGLYINNRDNIDALRDKTNAEFFSLYKYTRDKDDETNARIAALEVKAAKAEAVRPYQDELILCKINEVAKDAAFNLWKRTCRMVEGVNTLPLTPEVTGVLSQTCCNQQLLAALAGGGAGAGA